ncbi:MAG TPA: MFS transporter, partial [Gammaproteobacteria bacterium]|nr:MFS transporter [Gammaproteobacteria bacterium]
LRAAPRQRSGERLDAVGFGLLVLAAGCATYVLQQGSRWNWLDEPMIVGLAVTAAGAALLFLARQQSLQGRGALVDFSVLRHPDYAFAFVVTFVAGFALFGSAYLIPAFAIGVLGFTARDAGLLLLPSAALIALALVAAGALVQFRRVPPLAFVPFGIGLFMTAMWMLSRSTAESSFPDLAPALLVRGLGLGLLFIALVLFAFGGLRRRLCVHGVALFSLGRQLGGLIGAAALETCLDHGSALGRSVLAARLSPGDPAFDAWRTRAGEMLAAQGLADGQVGAAANGVIFRTLDAQAHVLAFDHAFLALAGLFVVAAPVLVALKIVLKKRRAGCAQPHEPRDPPGEPRGSASGRRRLALFHYFTT